MDSFKNIKTPNLGDIKYIIAQFPGGGQRGYATALLLKFFEETTGLPTHQLFPNVIASSVGIIITAALYSPHKDQKSALMTASQLCGIFPSITKRLPETAAKLWNNNDWDTLGNAIGLIIGDVQLKDMLGSVQFTSHKLGAVKESGIIFGKIIDPQTNKVIYDGNPETSLMHIIRMGTALPSIYKPHNEHIDIAFSDSCAIQILKFTKIFKGQGSFIRVGNFRTCNDPYIEKINRSALKDVVFGAIHDAISDDAYSRTIRYAIEEFGKDFVFNLEHVFSALEKDAPAVIANATTDDQFRRIETYTQKYIEEHRNILTAYATRAKEIALQRMNDSPETFFGISTNIQEFPLPEIPAFNRETGIRKTFNVSGHALTKASQLCVRAARLSIQMAFQAATSEPVIDLLEQAKSLVGSYLQRAWEKCLPSLEEHSNPPRTQKAITPPGSELE